MEDHNDAMAQQHSQQEATAAGAAADVPAAEPPAAEPQLDDDSATAAQHTDADTSAAQAGDSGEPAASDSQQQLQPQQEQVQEEAQEQEEAPASAAAPVPAATDDEQQPQQQEEQQQQQHEAAAQHSSSPHPAPAPAPARCTAAQTRTLAATAGCLPKGLTFTGPPYVPKAKPYQRVDYSHSAVQLLKIEHDNHLLFKHLTTIGSAASPKRPGAITPCNVASSAVNRRKAATTIAQENHALYQRLVAIRPSKDISRDTLEAEHRQAEGYRINCAQFKPGHPHSAKCAAAAASK